ncbi:hypothetical protein PSN_5582 [Pseudomonas sp. NGC7]
MVRILLQQLARHATRLNIGCVPLNLRFAAAWRKAIGNAQRCVA